MVNELADIPRNRAKRYFMRIIISVHEAYLLFSTLIQPPHHALPVKWNRHEFTCVRKKLNLLLTGTKQNCEYISRIVKIMILV